MAWNCARFLLPSFLLASGSFLSSFARENEVADLVLRSAPARRHDRGAVLLQEYSGTGDFHTNRKLMAAVIHRVEGLELAVDPEGALAAADAGFVHAAVLGGGQGFDLGHGADADEADVDHL